MKHLLLSGMLIILLSSQVFAQDTIYIKGGEKIIAYKIKDKQEQYTFNCFSIAGQKIKTLLLKSLVDSVKQYKRHIDTAATVKKRNKKEKKAEQEETKLVKPWQKTLSFGFNLGNVLEFNNPFSADTKNISLTLTADAGLNYKKDGKRFAITNELHYLFGMQKNGLTAADRLQRVQDDISTLHDASVSFGKSGKWNFNTIIRSSTSLINIYDGDFFKDYTLLGKIKAFASPYDVTVSPGIKYQPTESFRISLSPYSFNMYGINNNSIRNKGIYITDINAYGNYKNFLFKRLGAEINFWFDKRVKEWLEVQYRLGFSSDYFEKFGKNGKMDGLFITRVKIFKDVYLTHRITIKNDLSGNLLKPYFNQNILLSYSKTF